MAITYELVDGGVYAPRFVCDTCHKGIDNAHMALALWWLAPTTEPVGTRHNPVITHKCECTWAAEAAHGGRSLSMQLNTFIEDLAFNTTKRAS